MLTYILRRLILMVPTLLGVTAVVFFIMALSPGGVGGIEDAGSGELDSRSGQFQRDYLNQRYGLDQPKLVQYGRWLNRVSPVGFDSGEAGKIAWGMPTFKWPDLGESLAKRRPVTQLYREALPITLLLNAVTTPLVYVCAIVLGLYMARTRGGLFDNLSGVFVLILWSIPVMAAGVLLIGFLANRDQLYLFPVGGLSSANAENMPFLPGYIADPGGGTVWTAGWLLDRAWHLVLPVLCLTYGGLAFLAKLTRGSMIETLQADYSRTARAKGVSANGVLFRHAFRNGLIPLITVSASLLPGLLAGSIIVEQIFSLPGMGKLTLEAIFARDRELVLAGTLVSGVLGLVSILIADLGYALADPRVSYD